MAFAAEELRKQLGRVRGVAGQRGRGWGGGARPAPQPWGRCRGSGVGLPGRPKAVLQVARVFVGLGTKCGGAQWDFGKGFQCPGGLFGSLCLPSRGSSGRDLFS